MDLKKTQKDIWQNKINKGFNTTDVNKEFCLLYGEVSEAYDAWKKKKEDLNEELADIAIYLMGLSEMLGFDLESEIQKKVEKNEKRVYKNVNGVNVRISDLLKKCDIINSCGDVLDVFLKIFKNTKSLGKKKILKVAKKWRNFLKKYKKF